MLVNVTDFAFISLYIHSLQVKPCFHDNKLRGTKLSFLKPEGPICHSLILEGLKLTNVHFKRTENDNF